METKDEQLQTTMNNNICLHLNLDEKGTELLCFYGSPNTHFLMKKWAAPLRLPKIMI